MSHSAAPAPASAPAFAPAPGETDLRALLAGMRATLDTSTTYVWAHIPARTDADAATVLRLFAGTPVLALVREPEGWTVVAARDVALDIGLQNTATFACRRIALAVHSSLDAVGLMAAVSARLASVGIAANPVSAYYHDHLFVPEGKEDAAMEALRALSAENGGGEVTSTGSKPGDR